MPPSLDFSALDWLYLPQWTNHDSISLAERLEYLAYFTTARGMGAFLAQDTLQQRQRLVSESETSANTDTASWTIDPSIIHLRHDDFDPLDSTARQIIHQLQSIILTKPDRNVITLDWSASVQEACSSFFTPLNIGRFLEYFWSLWYPNCPIVHRPSFDPETAHTSLVCVMIIIGACLSPHEEDASHARMWLDSVEELIFSNDLFREQLRGKVMSTDAPSQQHWKKQRLETLTYVFLFDAALTIFHNSPPRMVVSELKMDMACPEACFQAETDAECFAILKGWEDTIFWRHRLSVSAAVKMMCQKDLDSSLVQEFARMGTLNMFTTVQSLHSLTFHLQNSIIFEPTLTPVQTGLKNWRRVWNKRGPEDRDIPDHHLTIWKKIGFTCYAPEFWHLARIILDKIQAEATAKEQDPLPTSEQRINRYDHTDMKDVNVLIMEYRRLNLGVTTS
ncbi:hypothetical protein FE257_009068 [Aspergillus nanangensis]|uniref:Xylanolytic transcriptional activator regulatory domain-containing protein n=1 Tax=Aspergillus nanangensis TaxID=2582783 RepID=A0AAD4CWN0_ASPNN|nr:hypothetical protein FE257_009068 [Aspergillus nanangensis]